MRIPMMVGNWKMNNDNDEAWELASAVAEGAGTLEGCQVVLCPPFTALTTVSDALENTDLALGAQNLYWENSGAFTGEISAPMLTSCGCEYVIVGHSERRGRFGKPPAEEALLSVFGDNDATVNRKVKAALAGDLIPIVCVGELLSERQEGKTDDVVTTQVLAALEGLVEDEIVDVIFAYEPVWAIGTGEVCEAEEANRVLRLIRDLLAEKVGDDEAEHMILLYGGSVNPGNIRGLMEQPEIDGGLVGGACLKAESFIELAEVAAEVKGE